MGKSIIRLNEKQFRQVIEESVKSVLNEMDQGVFDNAAKKAKELGQHQRAMRFYDYAATIAKRKAPTTVVDVCSNYITYKTVTEKEWCISAKARSDVKNYTYNVNDFVDEPVPMSLRTTDVRTAKYVADWCNRYSTNKHNFTKNDFIA